MAVQERSLGEVLAEEERNIETPVAETPVTTPETITDTIEVPETPAATPAPEQQTNFSDFDLPDETPEGVTVQTPQDWKTVLKSVDKKELLKELDIPELDEFEKGFIQSRRAGIDPYKYIEAKGIDWNKVDDDSLLKMKFNKEYASLSPEDRAYLFNKKYGVSDEMDEDDVRMKNIQKKADAHEERLRQITEQKSYTIPAYAQPEQADALKQIAEQQALQQQQDASVKQYIQTSEATQKLLADKRVIFDAGNGVAFNFNIKKPEALVDLVLNPEKSRKLTRLPDGSLDLNKLYMTSLFLTNPQKVISDLVNYGKTLQLDKQVEEGQNAGLPPTKPTVQSPVSEKEAWKTATTVPLGQLLQN